MSEDFTTVDASEPTEEELMTQGAAALRDLLASEPTTEEEIVAVLARRLDDPITVDTWSAILHSLTSYAGTPAVNLIAWAGLSDPLDETRLAAIEEAGGDTVANLVRRITAQFGDELRYAYEIWGQLPYNWRGLHREVYFDLINNRHHIRIKIEKYGGETTILEGPADSILGVASFLLGALRFTADPNTFGEERLREFAEQLDGITELLHPRLEALDKNYEPVEGQSA